MDVDPATSVDRNDSQAGARALQLAALGLLLGVGGVIAVFVGVWVGSGHLNLIGMVGFLAFLTGGALFLGGVITMVAGALRA